MTSTVTPDSPNTSALEGVPGPLIPGTRHDALIGDGAQAVMTRYWQYGKGMNDGTFPEGSYPVLLVHGFRGDHHGLEIIANYLLKLIPNVSIISPDLPGFGRSGDLSESALDEDSIDAYVAWLQDFVERTVTPSVPSSPAPSRRRTLPRSRASRSSTPSANPPWRGVSASPRAWPRSTTAPARHYPKKSATRCCVPS